MPRLHRRRRAVGVTVDDVHLLALVVGADFFHGWPKPFEPAAREAWRDARVRARAYAYCTRRHQQGYARVRPWAADEFGVDRQQEYLVAKLPAAPGSTVGAAGAGDNEDVR